MTFSYRLLKLQTQIHVDRYGGIVTKGPRLTVAFMYATPDRRIAGGSVYFHEYGHPDRKFSVRFKINNCRGREAELTVLPEEAESFIPLALAIGMEREAPQELLDRVRPGDLIDGKPSRYMWSRKAHAAYWAAQKEREARKARSAANSGKETRHHEH